MTEVCLLGTASGLPAVDRFGQTLVVSCTTGDNNDLFLLDTGDGASSLLMRAGFDHRAIRAIFLSHMHADHHGGFAQVVKTCMHLGKSDPLMVLAPAEGLDVLRTYLQASYLVDDLLGFPIEWIALDGLAGSRFALTGGAALEIFENDHLAWFRRRVASMAAPPRAYTFESYSAVLHIDRRRIVYSGNLNGPTGADEMRPFVEPCDLLVTELAHVDPTELGRFLAGKAVQRTVITHLHPRWNGVSDEEIRALVLAGSGGVLVPDTVDIAADGYRTSV